MIGPPPFLRLVRRDHLQDRRSLAVACCREIPGCDLKILLAASAEILGAA